MLSKTFLLLQLLLIAGISVFGQQMEPANIKVQINMHPHAQRIPDTLYLSGEPVAFTVSLKNTANETMSMLLGQQWRYLRPMLERNGEVLAFKAARQKLLNEDDALHSPLVVVWLKPNEATTTDELELDDWYDRLTPGHYRLRVARSWKGKELVSNTAEFDVIAN